MSVLINILNASGKSRDALINCEELMRSNAEILVILPQHLCIASFPPPYSFYFLILFLRGAVTVSYCSWLRALW